MSQTTVLIGFAEAMSAPEVVWSLVDAGFRVIAFARRGRASALRYSRHVVCHEICSPETDIQSSLSDLNSLMTSIGSQAGENQLILFPLDDKAVWLCSKVEIGNQWILAGPTDYCADLALVKNLQVEAAREAGFKVPSTIVAHSAKDLFDFSAAVFYPIILKPAECVPILQGRLYSCRKWICANGVELERAIEEWQERVPLLGQKFVTGVGEGVFGLAAPEGVRAWSGHRRVRMMNPQGSGSSACASQPVSEEIRSRAQKFIAKTGWRGLFMIELLRDEEGRVWFVELNGRPWGSMALCRRQGLEYPAWHLELAMSQESTAGLNVSTGPGIVCRHAGREFMHMLFVLRGAKSNALKRWPSFWRTLGDIVHLHRSDGLYNWRQDDPKVFVADFYYTIHDNVFKGKS